MSLVKIYKLTNGLISGSVINGINNVKQKLHKGIKPSEEYLQMYRKDAYHKIPVNPSYVDPEVHKQQQADRFAAEQRAKDADARSAAEQLEKKTSALAFKNKTGISSEQWDKLQSRLKTPPFLTIAERKEVLAQIGGGRHTGFTSDDLNRHAETLKTSE